MTACCPHSPGEHLTTTVCDAQIHYPSEDYPCLCDTFTETAEGKCAQCQHEAGQHFQSRTCRPASGEACGCQQRT